MNPNLSPSLLGRLSRLVSDRTGLLFPPDRWADLERGLRSAAGEFGFEDVTACAEWLASSVPTRVQVETLASHLTVGETYFFREKAALRALEEQVFPELIRARRAEGRRLRVWSAGCCTGEEPYSLAMLLTKLLPDLAQWDVTILGTDINPRFLAKGAKGEYGEWSFRDAPPGLKDRFFAPAGRGRYSVLPGVKGLVTFNYLNLVDDVYPSLVNNTNAMDVILCRNVLIYLGPEQAARVIGRLSCSIAVGGWLFVGAAETSLVPGHDLAAVAFPGVTGFQKGTARVPPAQPPLQLQPLPPRGPPFVPPPAVEATPKRAVVAAEAPKAVVSPLAAARALYEQGRYASAAETLVAYRATGPTGAEAAAAMALLARAHANLGDLSQALHWCDAAVAGDKLDARLHYLRASILQEKPDLDEAAAALRRAIYLDPDFVMAHFALALLCRRRGKDADTPRHLNQARSLLGTYRPQDVLPDSEGITAERLTDIIDATAAAAALAVGGINGKELPP